ncbi:hypothetical protein BAS09_02105 [Elizabethkingia ursingii]|uniref:hypothetical protein n=1 Tax=Elizabethkingia ursingii TaxID=1756150 RepID=UPI0007507DED|nr:hypothetical protein [Elizabethkingia ursingii]KUY30709.1 hypothetical protein ATB96_12475 [Elizabethkingia ursingii]OPC06397.1 hypothetical protein BAS09_02105 [Elizabethkingia ursingii]
MADKDWYRNTTWDSFIEAEFEERLKRSRGAFHKSQYLRIQAICLLDSNDIRIQSIGIKLMERLINDFPTEEFSTIQGNEQLGDYYLKINDFDKAEKYFSIVKNHYEIKKTKIEARGMAELKLAKTYIMANRVNKYVEAYNICKEYSLTNLSFNSTRFYYAELVAHVCERLNKYEEAKQYAKIAIEISKITEPEFKRHKTVGLVNVTDKQLKKLQQLIKR